MTQEQKIRIMLKYAREYIADPNSNTDPLLSYRELVSEVLQSKGKHYNIDDVVMLLTPCMLLEGANDLSLRDRFDIAELFARRYFWFVGLPLNHKLNKYIESMACQFGIKPFELSHFLAPYIYEIFHKIFLG